MSARVDIVHVQGRAQLAQFLDVPFALHAHDPIWSPPLIDDQRRSLSPDNPLWCKGRGERDLFLALRDDRPVGRILAHVHHASNERHAERVGFFGLFECEDDVDVARALIDAATEAHRARGLTTLRGPYDLTIRECIGAVVDGFDEPASFAQSWNAPHVPRLLEQLGFTSAYEASTFKIDDLASCDAAALVTDKQRRWLADPRVRVRRFDLEHFDRDVRAATQLLNESFESNFGFVPMSEDEIAFMIAPMRRVVRPELTVFIELDGQPVGVGLFLPDFSLLFRRMNGRIWPLGWARFLVGAPRLTGAVGQFIATSPTVQNLGLMRIVISELVTNLQAAGFRTLDGTWVGDSNAKSRAQMLAIGMREKHKLRLYAKPI